MNNIREGTNTTPCSHVRTYISHVKKWVQDNNDLTSTFSAIERERKKK